MAIEIERRFLVVGDAWRKLGSSEYYTQGYLSWTKNRIVRVRTINKAVGFITIKGKKIGISNLEFEYKIPIEDAEELLELCPHPILEKIRTGIIGDYGMMWEVDEFLGQHEGLIIAEIELEHENQQVSIPPWIGKEITGDHSYSNLSLYLKQCGITEEEKIENQ